MEKEGFTIIILIWEKKALQQYYQYGKRRLYNNISNMGKEVFAMIIPIWEKKDLQ